MRTAEQYRRLSEDCLIRAAACQDKQQQAEWFRIAHEWLTLANARAWLEERSLSQPSLANLSDPLRRGGRGCRSG